MHNGLVRTLAYLMVAALGCSAGGCIAEEDEPEDVVDIDDTTEQSNGNSDVVGHVSVWFEMLLEGHEGEEGHVVRNISGFVMMEDGSLRGGGANQVLEHDEILPININPTSWFWIAEDELVGVCFDVHYLTIERDLSICEAIPVSDGPERVDFDGDGQYDLMFNVRVD